MKTPCSVVVLVVEGNDAVRELLGDVLTRWQYEYIATDSLEEATSFLVELARGVRPLVVVFDLHIESREPGYSADLFLAEAERCNVQTLICTTTLPPEATPEAPPYLLLHKPFKLMELKALLEERVVGD